MDAASDPEVEKVILIFASQTGKTSAFENIIGFHIGQDPSPILTVLPTLEMAEAFSRDRLAPMLRDTTDLSDKVADRRRRDSDNQVRHKSFRGGHITLAGANSPASLAARPIRIVLCDEVDRFPFSAGNEGDPVSLATKRTATFWNRKIALSSTPTIKGLSRIEQAYEESDQRRFWVPCPHCGDHQAMAWAQVRWSEGRPEEAAYACEHCGAVWSQAERIRAVQLGEWRAAAAFNGAAGFHLNALYSPWVKLGDLAQEFLAAKRHPARLQVFVNTVLAETWEEDAERVDAHALEARAETWSEDGRAPAGVLAVSCGVDVQDDRLEVERVGWGIGEESWSLDHRILYGDPSAPDLWKELDAELLTPTATVDGRDVPVAAAAIDTGGHHTQAVYNFCRPRFGRRVYAIKGSSIPGSPVWPKRASKNNKGKVHLFMVGVSAAKDMVMARLKVPDPGLGYCHFPLGRDPEFYRQLTAERAVTRYVRGLPRRDWVKADNQRNEAFDLRVYAYAALVGLNVKWGHLARKAYGSDAPPVPTTKAVLPEPVSEETAAETVAAKPKRRPVRRVFRSSVVR